MAAHDRHRFVVAMRSSCREHSALHRGRRIAAARAIKGSKQVGFTIVSLTIPLTP